MYAHAHILECSHMYEYKHTRPLRYIKMCAHDYVNALSCVHTRPMMYGCAAACAHDSKTIQHVMVNPLHALHQGKHNLKMDACNHDRYIPPLPYLHVNMGMGNYN